MEPPVKSSRRSSRSFLLFAILAASEMAGMGAVVRSYTIAQSTLSGTSEFVWFWGGMFLLELPLMLLIAGRSTRRATRTALLILYGLVSFAPKLLRNPSSPVYHDEFAHWRETHEILTTGKLFEPNPIIPIIARYPGMHAATAALVHVTGLTIWQAATVLLILCHVALVLGLAVLAQSLGLNNRTAAVVAVLYSLNSSFLYFDTQYAYESVAISLAVWTLIAYVRAIRQVQGRGRVAWSMLTVLLAAGTVITHHLSTFTLILIMGLLALAMSMPWLARPAGPDSTNSGPFAAAESRADRDARIGWPSDWTRHGEAEVRNQPLASWVRSAATAWSLTLTTALMAGAWFHFVAPTTWSYLSPFLGEGLSELLEVAKGTGSARQLFGASLSPWWEQKAAYLVPVLAFAFAVAGLLLIRAGIRSGRLPRGRRRALLCGFAALGIVYFPSTVFILAPAGAEGARRSWAFTWIGLCMVAGPAAVWLLDWVTRRARHWLRFGLLSGLAALLGIALVGGTSAGLDASSRFPGPFLFGSDARSVTPELLAMSKWFSARFGPGHNVVTDRYTGLVIGSFGLQNPAAPSAGFPVYNLYLAKPGRPITPAFLLFDLSLSRYTYLIVDDRMAYDLPALGIYFTPNDPASLQPHNGKPAFYGRLNKFSTMSWMVKVFQSGNYSVYRLNFPANQVDYQHKAPARRGEFLAPP